MITTTTATTTIVTPDPLAALALNPRVYWLRSHQRAVARVRRLSAIYECAWQSGQPAMREWGRLQIARRRAAYCYRQLCRVMDWR